jgi:hypothetical protein
VKIVANTTSPLAENTEPRHVTEEPEGEDDREHPGFAERRHGNEGSVDPWLTREPRVRSSEKGDEEC